MDGNQSVWGILWHSRQILGFHFWCIDLSNLDSWKFPVVSYQNRWHLFNILEVETSPQAFLFAILKPCLEYLVALLIGASVFFCDNLGCSPWPALETERSCGSHKRQESWFSLLVGKASYGPCTETESIIRCVVMDWQLKTKSWVPSSCVQL